MHLHASTVYTREATLTITVIGPPDGEPVLLSHPLMMGTPAFEPLMQRLASRGYRVIAWDHYGQGVNRPLRGTLEMDLALTLLSEQAKWVNLPRYAAHDAVVNLPLLTVHAAEVIEGMGLHRPHFVGQGLGAMVGLRLAAWRPDLLASVTAIAASVEAEHHSAALHALADHIEKHGAAGGIDLGGGNTPVVELLGRACFGAWTRRNRPGLVAMWEQQFGQLKRIAPSIRVFADRDPIVDDLRGCRVPVLAIAGAEDVFYPPRVSAEAVAAAAGGRHVTIAHAGHSVALEQPEAVVGHLVEQFALADRIGQG